MERTLSMVHSKYLPFSVQKHLFDQRSILLEYLLEWLLYFGFVGCRSPAQKSIKCSRILWIAAIQTSFWARCYYDVVVQLEELEIRKS